MPMTHVDSLKVTSRVKPHLNAALSPADLPRKKRVPGACDLCKRKKIRCDSGEMPDNKCTNCIQFSYECTHKEITKHLGPAKGYVEGLEQKLERLEKLLNKVLPGVDLNQDVDVPPMPLPRNDLDITPFMQQFSKLQINPPLHHFFGRSSTLNLVRTALDIKSGYTATGSPAEIIKRLLASRRPDVWGGPSRFRTISLEKPTPPRFTFPEPDLLRSLVDLYFKEFSIYFPLLHRPTFESNVAEDLHLKDHKFGAVVLLVCALGAKFSDDPRVFSDISMLDGQGMSDKEKAHTLLASCGWKWYEQVDLIRRNLSKRPTLYEFQAHALSALFGHSSEEPHGTWTQMGIAMRMAQDVGAHRKCTKYESRARNELWRRAFWVIACQDRTASAFTGRPLCLQAEDIDVEFPTECDDEYWDHIDPEQQFQQPVGKPSTMAFFTCYLNLTDILAWAMRSIYSLSRPHLHRFASSLKYSEQQGLTDLDSAMNSWMGALPEHLRWNPNEENPIFLAQSATIHAMYYQLQIFIHRPFIPSPRNPTPSIYPSLAICMNAARSCCHVLETQSKRNLPPLYLISMPTFTAAVVLLLNIWSGKRSGVNMYPRREYEDVQKCLVILKRCEERWPIAGRLWEILRELSSIGDAGYGFGAQPSTTPRSDLNSRETSPASTSLSPTSSPSQTVGTPSSSVPSPYSAPLSDFQEVAPSPTAGANTQQRPNFALPFYTNELGRLPVFGQFSFSDPPPSSGPVNSMAFIQRLAPDAFEPSQFVVGKNDRLGASNSSSGAPALSVFAAPTSASTTASSLAASTSSLPISSLPHPITAQSNFNTQAGGGSPFATQNKQQDIFSLGNSYPYQASTPLSSTSNPAEDALVTAQLMAQFSSPGLGNMNNSGGLGLSAIPGFGPSLGNIPNLGMNHNMRGGPSGDSSGRDASGQIPQLFYGTNQMILDEDVLTMWSTAPSGFELDDWGTYITSVDQIMRDQTMM
ncbi:hypothetical protein BDN72DRAFT_844202 [Pluteus cervinus]|uniref:Uncharacterized protein n=1 Tax=Pluteus cervinus TaxID=181527 RepID=A0ACD3ALF8_9AGAR|nr:hypothetical protein BDN72DRAFT_844202 [Pluteus cervinus]